MMPGEVILEETPMQRTLVWIAALALSAAPALAQEQAESTEHRVVVGHNSLEPADLTISTGDRVVFHNKDAMPGGHRVVADNGMFISPALTKGESWTTAFTKPGTYDYRIKEHPDTRGKISVVGPTPPSTPESE